MLEECTADKVYFLPTQTCECWFNLPQTGKLVTPTTKAYANVSGASARVWTTHKLFQSSSHPKKGRCCMSENFYYIKTKRIPPPKTQVVQWQKMGKIHENLRNSASNPYWYSAEQGFSNCGFRNVSVGRQANWVNKSDIKTFVNFTRNWT